MSGRLKIDRNSRRIFCMGTVFQFQDTVRYMKGAVEAWKSLETNATEARSSCER